MGQHHCLFSRAPAYHLNAMTPDQRQDLTQDLEKLRRRALRGLAKLMLAMSVILFLPAWSLRFWQGWLYLAVFGGCCVATTLYFLKHDPKLVERRAAAGPTAEKQPAQKIIMTLTSACFLLLIVIPALDHRWHWSHVPVWLVLLSDAGFVLSFFLIALVLRQNSYAASTIQVETQQPVISTGAYALVRHPMYAAALPMFIFTPLALGSYWGLLVVVVMTPALIWRLLDEEHYLARNLPGYTAYCARTRTRLIPFVW
jgi:protein-S-isoprenylcysteine O-methyltransferase Ste14